MIPNLTAIQSKVNLTVIGEVRSLINSLNSERERLKTSLDSEQCGLFNSASSQNTISLKDDLSKILKQNLDLKNRLLKIHEASNLEEVSCLDASKEKVSVCNSLGTNFDFGGGGFRDNHTAVR